MHPSDSRQLAYLILLVSAALQFAVFSAWPGSPDGDVVHSIFAADNLVKTGHLQSINFFPQASDDLAQYAQIYWMTHWPPAHSWLYALAMWPGLSPGTATKILGLLGVLAGGIGWIRLMTMLEGSRLCATVLAATYPWVSLLAGVYINYRNDHLAIALMPWMCVGIVQIAPSPANAGWTRLITTALLSGSAILVKYSMAPLLAATGLYYLWLESRPPILTVEKALRVAAFSTGLLLPGAFLFLVNRAWGVGSYPLRAGGGIHLGALTFLNNIASNTFGAPTGWSALVIQLNLLLEAQFGVSLFKGAIFAVSTGFIVIWVVSFARTAWTKRQSQFLEYLCLSTIVLWVLLYATTTTMSATTDNFAGDSRFYLPIAFAWMVLGAVSLDKLPCHELIRSPRFYSLVVPLLFNFVFYAGFGLFGRPYATMPNSGIYWLRHDFDQNHAAFLSRLIQKRGKKPDLIITGEDNVLLEVGVPFYWNYRNPGGPAYVSSRNLEIWAMLDPNEEQIFLSRFRNASSINAVTVPPGFPFKFYILYYVSGNS